jgi:hypothetical protein
MVKTRAQTSKILFSAKTELEHLREEVARLTKENNSLVQQFSVLCNEYDELKKVTKVTGSKKSKTKKASFKPVQELSADECQIQYMATNDLIMALFQNEFTPTCELSNPPKCTQSKHVYQQKPSTPTHSHQGLKSKCPTINHSPMKRNFSQQTPRTIVIGTSMVKDITLRKHNIDALTYCYPGQYIPYISSRVASILRDENPDFVVLQCGGNDVETCQNFEVIKAYESLVETTRTCAPNATIILGAIPPRGKSSDLQERIDKVNTYLRNKAKQSHFLEYFSNCPTLFCHFKRDLVHFNSSGSELYSYNLASHVSYCYSFPALHVSHPS